MRSWGGGAQRQWSVVVVAWLMLSVSLAAVPGQSANDCSTGGDAGDTPATATPIGAPQDCVGDVSAGDPSDHYRFTPGDERRIEVEVSTNDLDVEVCVGNLTNPYATCFDDVGVYATESHEYYSTSTVNLVTVNRTAWTGVYRLAIRYLPSIAPFVQGTISCNPATGTQFVSSTCSFTATDADSASVSYSVDWGDGNVTRVPTTGHVPEGVTQSASHAYGAGGSYVIRVNATDDYPYGGSTSGTKTLVYVVDGNQRPLMQLFACTPSTQQTALTVTCSVRAGDDAAGVYYTIDWRDGSPVTRVPATGFVPPSTTHTATHAFAPAGTYALEVRATDDGATPLVSKLRYATQTIVANGQPSVTSVTCDQNPSLTLVDVACHVTAADDSTGVFFTIDWGDGSPVTTVPASGYVAPGTTVSATHAWASTGSFTVAATATDNNPVPLTSASATTPHTVVANQAPVMQALSCAPSASRTNQIVTCSVRASDDSAGVYYLIDWGDASPVTRVPSSGLLAPGVTVQTHHAWANAGSFTVTATATDDNAAPLTSSAVTTTQAVRVPFTQTETGRIAFGHPLAPTNGVNARAGPSPFDGLDGVWVPLASPAIGDEPVRLTFTGTGLTNLNVYFHGANLNRVFYNGCAMAGNGSGETCQAPPGAEWAFVVAAAGANAVWSLVYEY